MASEYVHAGDGLLFHNHDRMTKLRMEEFAKKFELHAMAFDGNEINAYQLKCDERTLIIRKEWMEESFDFTTNSKTQKIHYRSIPTPTKIRDQLFGDQYMSLEAALNRALTHHENTILKPILNGNVFFVF